MGGIDISLFGVDIFIDIHYYVNLTYYIEILKDSKYTSSVL